MKIYDLSILLSEEMHIFPGDPPFTVKKIAEISEGKTANISSITMGSHTGTHIDPPLHFVKDSQGINKIPLDRFVGRAIVIDLYSVETEITEKDLKEFDEKITMGDIVLFKTKNSEMWDGEEFREDFIYLTKDAGRYLLKKGIKTVGIDYLSIEEYGSKTAPIHHLLLENGVPIIEGLNLKGIKPGEYFFACLPLKIKEGDGAPARAILIEGL